jgi:cytochrome-b5 reductase
MFRIAAAATSFRTAAAVVATAATVAGVASPFVLGASRMGFASSSTAACDAGPVAPAPALDAKEFRPFTLLRAEQLTRDTKRYTFALPRENDELGLTVASCLVVRATVDGKEVVRPYTPTSPVHERGTFELIVKSYPDGKVSKAMSSLKPGDQVDMKGPFLKFAYSPNQWKGVGMLAGGTGITPFYQLLHEILSNPRDKTEVRLVYASRSPEDIILKKELDALAVKHPNFKVFYAVDTAPDSWKDGVIGRVSKEIIADFCPPPHAGGKDQSASYKMLVCGPPGFMKVLSGEKASPMDQGELTGLLKEMGYAKDQVFKF